ncbi:hypothetical protein GCM10010172_35230 [Paractinoplanes ferrugineus]|uniref:Uncharacterized protein n=1 Tax=Paractinoplanes ferrugineus TaxID=113564 RepID=A0A919JBF7_9ACTN|nr:hypothetical protein [Actinoplanes ferrugineus]GIE16767.1 hypothetical protein Afe05nite_86070 [Actinoplanes ferrugineus]
MSRDVNVVGRRLVEIVGEAATIAMVEGALEAWRKSNAIFTHDVVAAVLVGAFENLPEDLRVLDLRAPLDGVTAA